MIKILFVCHGNICRSPMAEFILKDMVQKRGIAADFHIASAATSNEAIIYTRPPGQSWLNMVSGAVPLQKEVPAVPAGLRRK